LSRNDVQVLGSGDGGWVVARVGGLVRRGEVAHLRDALCGVPDTVASASTVAENVPGFHARQRMLDPSLTEHGLIDELRPGGLPRSLSDTVEEVIAETLERAPVNATHWSRKSMAARSGLSKSTGARSCDHGRVRRARRDVHVVHAERWLSSTLDSSTRGRTADTGVHDLARGPVADDGAAGLRSFVFIVSPGHR
jgi:hypothetical protein